MVIMAAMLPVIDRARRRRLPRGLLGAPSSVPPPITPPARGARRSPASPLSSAVLEWTGHCTTVRTGRRSWSSEEEHRRRRSGLGGSALEAKERLDHKFMNQRAALISVSSQSTKGNSSGGAAGAAGSVGGVRRETYSSKKDKFTWSKLLRRRRRNPPPEECAVCLDEFTAGDALASLPCRHSFHWRCAAKWLESTPRCPVCRSAVAVDAAVDSPKEPTA